MLTMKDFCNVRRVKVNTDKKEENPISTRNSVWDFFALYVIIKQHVYGITHIKWIRLKK